MSRFDDYNASQIVPQKTLLEKFNKLIKFLKENPSVSLFYVNDDYSGDTYDLTDVYVHDYVLKEDDIVIFKNNYYAPVIEVSETQFKVGTGTCFKGEQGEQGIQGEQGVGISNITINASQHLIITLTNGNVIDAGYLSNVIVVDSALSSTSENPVQNKVIYTALGNKQDNLTFDNSPTQNSDNPVKSGGIYTAIKNEKYNVISIYVADLTTGSVSFTAEEITLIQGEKIKIKLYNDNESVLFTKVQQNQSYIAFSAIAGFNIYILLIMPNLLSGGITHVQGQQKLANVAQTGIISKYIGFDSSNNIVTETPRTETTWYKHEFSFTMVDQATNETVSITGKLYNTNSSKLTLSEIDSTPWLMAIWQEIVITSTGSVIQAFNIGAFNIYCVKALGAYGMAFMVNILYRDSQDSQIKNYYYAFASATQVTVTDTVTKL